MQRWPLLFLQGLKLGLILFTITISVASAEAANAPQVDEVIERLSKRLPSIRNNLSELETNRREKSVLRRDLRNIQRDLDKTLDEIIELMVGKDYAKNRKRLFEASDRIAEIEVAIDELRILHLGAPVSPPPDELGWVDWTLRRDFPPGSKEAIAAEIEDKTEELRLLKGDELRIVNGFLDRMRVNYDLELTEDQARAVLYQINGSSIVEAAITFSVFQLIETRFAEIREATANDAILRRYYGLAAALRLINVRLHDRHLAQYADDWLPAIESLAADHRKLISETENALAVESNAKRIDAYRNNLKIQTNVSTVIDDYHSLLLERKNFVHTKMQDAEGDAQLAINTLKTLENAAILFDQFSWSDEQFQGLMDIKNAKLIPLSDADISNNYLDLSRQMTGS